MDVKVKIIEEKLGADVKQQVQDEVYQGRDKIPMETLKFYTIDSEM